MNLSKSIFLGLMLIGFSVAQARTVIHHYPRPQVHYHHGHRHHHHHDNVGAGVLGGVIGFGTGLLVSSAINSDKTNPIDRAEAEAIREETRERREDRRHRRRQQEHEVKQVKNVYVGQAQSDTAEQIRLADAQAKAADAERKLVEAKNEQLRLQLALQK